MLVWGYILRLQSGALSPGATTDPSPRYADHLEGHARRTCGSRQFVIIELVDLFGDRQQAARLV